METMNELAIYRTNQKPDQLIQKLHNLATDFKRKEERRKESLRLEIQQLEEFLQTIPRGSDNFDNDFELSKLKQEIVRRKEECEAQVKNIERKKKELHDEKQRVAKLVEEMKEQQANSEKMYPRVRYSVNLYRDFSHIKWHSDAESNEVTGYINTKLGIKTFRFDKSKQSQFFITNSLWDMGDEM